MASRRKQWEDLTPTYRKRLERGGITKSQYESGVSVAKARGHQSEQREQERRRHVLSKKRYIARMTRQYGVDEDSLQDEVDELSESELNEVMALQAKMERAYMSGKTDRASRMFRDIESSVPSWMLFYHGVFNG